MGSLLGLGAVAMIAADAIVGVRLLGLARRTRRLPEAALGAALVLFGALGYPLATAARRDVLATPGANAVLMAVAMVVQNLGCLAIYVYTARTFRAGRPPARGVVAAAALALAASWTGQLATTGFAPHAMGAAYWLGLAVRAAGFAWAFGESVRTWGLARRRLRLGLADPIVTNRFLLFALAMAGVLAAFAIFTVGQLTTANVAASSWVLACTSVVGFATGVVTWLAFLPPAAWRRTILARAARAR